MTFLYMLAEFINDILAIPTAWAEFIYQDVLALPATIIFIGVSVILTIKTGFVQLRGIPRFVSLMIHGVEPRDKTETKDEMTTFQALFSAMATTIGMGNIVSPSLAIIVGGPGALFWLLLYMFIGSVNKYTEVVFALDTREYLPNGFVLGGPIQYLKTISLFLSQWYGYIIVVALSVWSAAQANTLSHILAIHDIPQWMVGGVLSVFVVVALLGGAHRVGEISSKLVPIMFVLYLFFTCTILFSNPAKLLAAIRLMFNSAFQPSAAMGGFLGASIFQAVRAGIFRGIFVTESGLGTSSIPHSLANTKNPADQGILAMASVFADMLLSALSGLLVLVTGVWMHGSFRSTLVYEGFQSNSSGVGQYVLLISIILFVLTTAIGNSFNGMQSLGVLTRNNKIAMNCYIVFTAAFIFIGSLMDMKLLWNMIDILLIFIAVPNLLGVLYLAFKRPQVLDYTK